MILNELKQSNIIEKAMQDRPNSAWKLYECLHVRYDVYPMDTPIGTGRDSPQHFKEGSFEKALVRFDGKEYHDGNLCFWRCL